MKENTPPSRPGKPGPDPQGGSFISLEEAAERTRRFRDDYVDQANDKKEKIKGNFFSKQHLLKLLNQPGCEGIRIYYSVRAKIDEDAEGKRMDRRDLIVVGTDKYGDDILKIQHGTGCNPFSLFMVPASSSTQENALLLAEPSPCPDICGKPNPLNGGA